MRRRYVRPVALAMSAVIGMGMAGVFHRSPVMADWVKTADNTYMGTGAIKWGFTPENADSPWTGSYVYYGRYDGDPIRFRVMTNNSYSIFLDSDRVLFYEPFDCIGESTNEWASTDCTLNRLLNGEEFLYREDGFSEAEIAAICDDNYIIPPYYEHGSYCEYRYGDPVPEIHDRVFLLDASDVTNMEFGYSFDSGWDLVWGDWEDEDYAYHVVASRQKYDLDGNLASWWLRSADNYHETHVGTVDRDGDLNYEYGALDDIGVAPALCVDNDRVLFTSLVSGVPGQAGAEYKLTINSDDLGITIPEYCDTVMVDGHVTITIPYSVTETVPGTVNRISILVKDMFNGNILYYDELEGSRDSNGQLQTSGTGTLTLPDYLSDYAFELYVLAEQLNGQYETDYASDPVSIFPKIYEYNYEDVGNGHVNSNVDFGYPGLTATLEPVPDEGYRFSHWEVISGGVTITNNRFTFGNENVLIRAYFEPESSGNPSDPGTTTPSTPTPTPSPASTTPAASAEQGVAGFVERLYTVALGRTSDPAGKQDWIDAITLRGETGASAARGFLYSPEFLNKNCTTEEFVTVLYRTFFDREPDQAGFSAWVAVLKSGSSKEEVIEGFINSTEWANLCLFYGIRSGGTGTHSIEVEPNAGTIDFATRLYTTCLGRAADENGLMAWARQLANQRETGTGAARGFFFSSEFTSQNVSNGEYVTRLYRTFMGREPDAAGFTAWVDQLDNGTSREEVFEGFAQSTEFTGICASYGIVR